MLSLLSLIDTAHAFCGTFVGAPGSELVNRSSQVVIARQGDKTTLTLVADYEGDLSDFALLIPVPESLEQNRVTALDPAIVDRLDRYSTPRLVQYTCGDALSYTAPGCALGGCKSADLSAGTGLDAEVEFGTADGTVTVEAQFQVAEYDVVLLSATGAGGLYEWLDENGFAVPPGGEDILGEYIESGSHFLAAKVHLDAVMEGSSRLSPLQLRYRSPDWTLPIRIGTISASGEQEVVIYALTETLDGDVAISNYTEGIIDDECMLPEGVEADFSGYYHDELRAVHPSDDEPSWTTEYNWTLYSLTQDTGYHCDPCTVEVEELYDAGELAELGFEDPGVSTGGTYGYYGSSSALAGNGALLTRIRMIYDPQDIHSDLVLYTKGSHNENKQIRYIRYDRRLEFLYPVCGLGYVEEPGMCGDELDTASKGRGRSGMPAVMLLLGAALAGLVTRRRGA